MNKKEVTRQAITAVIYIVVGVILARDPGMSASLLCTGIGICALAYGAITLIFYFLLRKDGDGSFNLPVGIAFAALGLFCLVAPSVVLSIIPLLFGIVLLIDGAQKLGSALELRRTGFVKWTFIACVAVILMIFGLMLVTRPFVAVESVMIMFGALLIADGALDAYFIFRIYRLGKNR